MTGRLFVCLLSLAALAGGACHSVEGDRILASHLAAVAPEFARLDPDLALAHSPAAGSHRTFRVPELRRLAARHGLELAQPASACFERPASRLSEDAVRVAVESALQPLGAQATIVDFSRHPLPAGRLEFSPSALPAPLPGKANHPVIWRGVLRHGEGRTVPVWVRLRLHATWSRLVAARKLEPGRPIEAGDVRLEVAAGVAPGGDFLTDPGQALGSLPRRSLPAGTTLRRVWLRIPDDVERGSRVAVTVRSGGAILRLEGLAETAGRVGDRVMVKNLASGRRFAATVEAPGEVAVRTGVDR